MSKDVLGTSPPDCDAKEADSRSDATSSAVLVTFCFSFFVFVFFFVALFFFTCTLWSSELGETASNSPGITCGNGTTVGSGTGLPCADVAVAVGLLVAVVAVMEEVVLMDFSDGFETPAVFGVCFFFLPFVPFLLTVGGSEVLLGALELEYVR